MSDTLLESFEEFLIKYRKSWNSCDVKRIMHHFSEDLQTRWSNDNTIIEDGDYYSSKTGWEQTYSFYEDRNPKWHFQDIVIEINKRNEAIAVFFVGFEVDGLIASEKLLYVETFQVENGEWKKIREYVETRLNRI